MNLPLLMTASHRNDGSSSASFSPFHERLTQPWRQLPAVARDAMRRTLGGRPLAPLPSNPDMHFSRHQPERVVVPAESPSEDMPFQPVTATSQSKPPTPPISHYPTPLGFVALLSAYRPTGGTVRADDLSRHVRSDEPGHLTNLARKLVSGSILSFSWRQTLWVPLFQFEPGSSLLRPGVTRIMDELAGAFDSWEIAVWFVQPNTWLKGQRPLDVLDRLGTDVLQAARADRFVAMG